MPFSDSVGFFALWPSMWPLISQVDKKKETDISLYLKLN